MKNLLLKALHTVYCRRTAFNDVYTIFFFSLIFVKVQSLLSGNFCLKNIFKMLSQLGLVFRMDLVLKLGPEW